MDSEITKQIKIICEDKDLEEDTVLDAIEKALASAYRKDFGDKDQNIQFNFDPETGDMEAWDEKEVVEDYSEEELKESQQKFEERRKQAREEGRELRQEELEDLIHFNEQEQIMVSDAKEIEEDIEVGDTLKIPLEIPGGFGRMAAQTAKQVIIQKLKEAERENVYENFKQKEGNLIEGVIQSVKDTGTVLVDLDKINGILPEGEQSPLDDYQPGMRKIFHIKSVEQGNKGPNILLSRATTDLVEKIFIREIPEIENNEVEIRSISREPGSRSKVAVFTDDDSIDPIGSCIGRRGSRITTIIDQLGGEKVDVIEYSDNSAEFIKNSLSPADVERVEISEYGEEATAYVNEDQFSLAIGKNGQNVRLAAELTGWVINVVEEGNEEMEVSSSEDIDPEDEEVEEGSKSEAKQENEIDSSRGEQDEGSNEDSSGSEEEQGGINIEETDQENS